MFLDIAIKVIDVSTGEDKVKRLEKYLKESPDNIEDRKSEFAIKMNLVSQEFESVWERVALRNPDLFPRFIGYRNDSKIDEAVYSLLNSRTKIVTRRQVSDLSGVPLKVVNSKWVYLKGRHRSSGYFED